MSRPTKKRPSSALSGQRPNKGAAIYKNLAINLMIVLGCSLAFLGLYVGQKRIFSWWSRIDFYPQSNSHWSIDVISSDSELSSAEKSAVISILSKEIGSTQKPNLMRLAKRTQAETAAKKLSLTMIQPQKILVTLSLYRPVAVVESKKKYLLSQDGFVYDGYKESANGDLPIITGVLPVNQNLNLTEAGAAILGIVDSREIAESLEILKLGREKSYIFQSLRFDEVRGFLGTIAPQGLAVFLGRGDYLVKFERLKEILDHLGSELNLTERIELDYSDKAVVKKKTM